ncbi:competence protein CoiA [Companilactobacillus sp.]|jgi:competence protein CoiA|uniref:competence protein CoiA n=2 Tax=Companilactobacillus sp. TaxID=2767905 RepID=UPI0025BB55F9|nr:competence protein CoiA family protein [Companilactobacillus sp.]MCH4008836.1 hypothetical protein [Companilactobacillus sp.]MCH4050985.1 hypothetical protein [Companilactobacillus sp.]MCH4076779.1 hypothetical protein [Companilactobacillus sp.]MCH4125354.1 hypothetical protein [Companilactobacillus sp.]MCH4131895.1 hypothetical protein [Companilactobacillus sp.]
MYAALNEKQQLINAIQCKNEGKYFCPRCQMPVKLTINEGTPFFRHENTHFNETNERDIHKHGKDILVKGLSKAYGRPIKSEVFLSKLEQRPDIMVNKQTVIEYQCAKIDLRKLSQRVMSYYHAGIDNYWILGGDYLDDKLTKQHLKFINHKPEWGFYILMLDSIKQKFTLFYEIRFVGPFNKIAYRKKSFNSCNLRYLLNFKPKFTSLKTSNSRSFMPTGSKS